MPDGMEMRVATFDGTELRVNVYGVTDAPRRVMIIHGFGEHAGRYTHVADHYVSQGWCVYIVDLRGHGMSHGPKAHVSRFDHYIQDVRCVIDSLSLPAAGTHLLAHSMGGLIGIRFMQTYPDRIQSAAITSPLLGMAVHVPWVTLAVGRLLSYVLPRFRFASRIDDNLTTRSQAVVERRRQDQLLHHWITARCFFEMKRGIADAWTTESRIRQPTLILQAGDDHIVDPQAPARWLATRDEEHVTVETFPGQYHELLNEPEWEVTLKRIVKWQESVDDID